MRSKATASFICVLFGILSSGCSFLFVTSPPANVEKLPLSEPVECTTSDAAPLIDAAIAGLQVLRTAYALSASDSDYSGAPISREADAAFGVALTGVFTVAAAYGFSTTGECSDAKADRARRRRRQREREGN